MPVGANVEIAVASSTTTIVAPAIGLPSEISPTMCTGFTWPPSTIVVESPTYRPEYRRVADSSAISEGVAGSRPWRT